MNMTRQDRVYRGIWSQFLKRYKILVDTCVNCHELVWLRRGHSFGFELAVSYSLHQDRCITPQLNLADRRNENVRTLMRQYW